MIFKNIMAFLPDGTLLKNANIIIRKDKIISISTKSIEPEGDIVYNGTGKLMIPGLINTHCHVPMALCRGLGADLPLSQWLNTAIFPMEAKLTEEFVYWGALLGISEMLRSGVTSFNDMYYFSPLIAKAVLKSGIKANLAYDENESLRTTGQIPHAKNLFENYHLAGDGRLKIDLCVHSEYTTKAKGVLSVADYAKETGANIQLHLCETKEEVENCWKRHQKSPVSYFADLGLFDSHTTAAHCVWLTEQDRKILAEKKVVVSHCPVSNLKLGSGIADIQAMKKDQLVVSIGTDGAASNDNLNMLEDIKLVPLLQKGIHQDASLFPASEVLLMATKNGALSQARSDTGALIPGNKADFAIVNYESVNMQPAYDAIAGLIYASTPADIEMTVVDGKILYEKGIYPTLDIELILAKIKEIAKIISR